MAGENQQQEVNRGMVTFEVTELLSQKSIVTYLNSYKTETAEKELAVEFVRSYLQFVEEIVTIDNARGLLRSDVELRDLVSHINAMLKSKDESTFSAMVFHCPAHYKSVHESVARAAVKAAKEEETG